MASLSDYASVVQPASGSAEVYKDDCMYCFNTCFDGEGLFICLLCFQSFCSSHISDHYANFAQHLLYLNYKKELKPQELLEEKPIKLAKLEIKEKSEEELFDLHTSLYDIRTDQNIKYSHNEVPMSISMTIDSVLKARSSEKKEEIKSWEQEIVPCEHAFDVQQAPLDNIDLNQCQSCDLRENLWICLICGSIGCGREQFGGVPGNSHAKKHFEDSQHAIAVKLGSLTSDSADVYCYNCNEEIKVPDLAKLLQTFNINLSNFEKTEKSLTELQLEQNLKWDFNMDGKNGEVLKPVFGSKLTGFKNLGNSCYLATVLQVLFSFKAFEEEFYGKPIDYSNSSPDKDLRIQLIKIANGLISGEFSIADESTTDSIKYQRGIKPSTFKALVGRDHGEFSTMRQQDAFEFWNFVLDKIDALYPSSDAIDVNPVNIFKFVTENKLRSDDNEVKFKNELYNSLSLPVKAVVNSVDETGRKIYDPISFESMFEEWHSEESIELGNKTFAKTAGFKTCPQVLAVNAQRIQLENWVPVKVDVPIKLVDSIDIFPYLSKGQLPTEVLLKDEDETSSKTNAWQPNGVALEQLQAMGFPEPRCLKALYNTGNSSADDAMNWLFAHMEDADIDDPFSAPPEESSDTVSPPAELVEQICGMGFSEKLATKALVLNHNNPDLAINWIFENPDDDGELPKTVTKTSDNVVIEHLLDKKKGSTKYNLQAIICHKGTSIHSGHYVCFIKKEVEGETKWVLFNDEKVVISDEANEKEMESSGYLYLFVREDADV